HSRRSGAEHRCSSKNGDRSAGSRLEGSAGNRLEGSAGHGRQAYWGGSCGSGSCCAAARADGRKPAQNSQRLASAGIDRLSVPERWIVSSSVVRSLILLVFISLLISLSVRLSAAAPATARLAVQQGRGEEQYTIAVDVDLVVFNVAVTDGMGRPVSGLKASDFHVYEENRLQNIKLFHAENVAASVGLLIDNSGSMLNKRADVVEAAFAFASASN